MASRAAHLVLLAAAAALLASCASLTRLAYSNAAFAYDSLDAMIAWSVDDYVDLSGAQKAWVRGRIARVMDWHRSQELPEYARFFEDVLARSEEPFSVSDVAGAWADVRRAYARTAAQVLPEMADFLLQLDPAQQAQLEERFAQDNRRLVRESTRGTPEARLARRVKRFERHLAAWIGPVTPAQRRLVEAHFRDVPDFTEERLAERRVRQTEVLSLLRARTSREDLVAALRRLTIETPAWRRPEYQRRLAEREQRFFELVSALSTTLSPEQRARLQGRLRGYLRDIAQLTAAKEGGSG